MDKSDRLDIARQEIQAIQSRPQWGLTEEPPFAPPVLNWMDALADTDRVVYFLNFTQLEQLRFHITYTDEQWESELALASRAERWSEVGIYLDGLRFGFRSPTYRTFTPFPSNAVSAEFPITARKAGMEYKQNRFNDLYFESRAAAGRLLCHPHFVAERDQLRELWRSLPLPIRPVLPLQQSNLVVIPISKSSADAATTSLKVFSQQVHGFLTRWRLQKMLTWDLPDPLCFHSETGCNQAGAVDDDSHVATISGLILLGKNDVRIPPAMKQRHAVWRASVGLQPISARGAKPAAIAQLQFLELALSSRVRATQSALTKTARKQLFALWTGLDIGNVSKRLRERAKLLKHAAP